MSINWPHGLGEATGDNLVTETPLQLSGQVWYVHFSGSDSNNGRDRVKPFATLAHAVSVANISDVILMLPGHMETINSQILINVAGITIVGAGSSNGKPSVKLTPKTGVNPTFLVSANFVSFRNVWFTEAFSSQSAPKITFFTAQGCLIKDCYFECGNHDPGTAVQFSETSDFWRVQGTTFISTATSVSTQPQMAIMVNTIKNDSGAVMEDVTFDGGTAGFSNFWAFDSSLAGGLSFRFERITLLNGADMNFSVSGSDVGILNVGTAQGGARIDWV